MNLIRLAADSEVCEVKAQLQREEEMQQEEEAQAEGWVEEAEEWAGDKA